MALPPNSASEPSWKLSSNAPSLRSIQFLTLFPELIEPGLKASLLGKAAEKGLLSFGITQIRDFATDKHRTVDDTPYGGGEDAPARGCPPCGLAVDHGPFRSA